jgi:pimeloyl-ACP methyl ester carboxylesterase
MKEIVGDLQAIADEIGGGKAILVGRDWGAPIVWNAAQADTQRFTAVCGMSIPHLGGGQQPAIDTFRKIFTENGIFFYMVYFQDEGIAEREIEADVRTSIRKFYYAWSAQGVWPVDKKVGEGVLDRLIDPPVFPTWMEPEQLDYLVSEFKQSGFRGPLNRYRNFHRDFEWAKQFQGRKISQPALFMAGEADGGPRMFGPGVQDRMRAAFDDLRGLHTIPGAGHWNQEENVAETNRLLLGWLKGL